MSEITYSRLVPADLERIGEIDRTERIDTLYVQNGERLDQRSGDFSAPAWFIEGEGEHSVTHQRAECERHLAAGGIALGAFANEQLVGIGIVRPHIRPRTAQFASLYVSNGHRSQGIGRHLGEELERLAANGATRRWSSRQRRLSTPCASTSTEASSRRRSRYRSFMSSSPRMCTCTSACRSRLCVRLPRSSPCSYERATHLSLTTHRSIPHE
jgi:GNAT superfamily N-acetyltransferase